MKFKGKNIRMGQNVSLGNNVRIGDNTIIYDNVSIGDNTIVCENCILGEPLKDYYTNDNYVNPELKIGADCMIRSNVILYSDVTIGDSSQIAHWAIIREGSRLGNHCMVGVYVHILDHCKIGNYVRFHSYDTIGENSQIDDFVFFYPFVAITTDPTPPSNILLACKIGKFTQIATGSILMPGVTIGKHCLVAAQSKVAGKFADYAFIAGIPAKNIMDVRQAPIVNMETKKRQYPWPYNFSRNMPWAEMGYDKWLEDHKDIEV